MTGPEGGAASRGRQAPSFRLTCWGQSQNLGLPAVIAVFIAFSLFGPGISGSMPGDSAPHLDYPVPPLVALSQSAPSSIGVGSGPWTATYDPTDGDLYVPNVGSDNVSVVSTVNHTVVATIPVGSEPQTPALDSKDNLLFVSNQGSSNVSVINASSNSVVASIPVGARPLAATYVASVDEVLISNQYSSNVTIIGAPNLSILTTIHTGSGPQTPVVDTQLGLAFISENGSAQVGVLSLSNSSIEANISVGAYPIEPALDLPNGTLYVPNVQGNSITVVNCSTLSVAGTLAGLGQPWTPVFDNATDQVYVPDHSSSTIQIVSAATNTEIGGLTVGLAPLTPAIDPVTGDLFVPVYDRSEVAIVSAGNDTLQSEVPVGIGPSTPTFVATAGVMYIANFGSGNLTLVSNGSHYASQLVEFEEHGLPNGTEWSVTLSSSEELTGGTSLNFTVPNGNYTFLVGSVPGYRSAPSSGALTVDGAGQRVQISFTAFTYGLGFTEEGLPSGTTWSANVSGVIENTTTSWLSFDVSNGTIEYRIGAVPGFLTQYGGVAIVRGMGTIVNVRYVQSTYPIDISESGLGSGTSWGFVLNSVTASSSRSSINVSEPNGTYTFLPLPESGYVTPTAGTIAVDGAAVFLNVTYLVQTYPVVFVEFGLPAGSTWGVAVVNSTLGIHDSARTEESSIGFMLPDGTFTYSFTMPAGYTAASANGTFGVIGTSGGVGPAVSTLASLESGGRHVVAASGVGPLVPWLAGCAVIAVIAVVGIVVVVRRGTRDQGSGTAPQYRGYTAPRTRVIPPTQTDTQARASAARDSTPPRETPDPVLDGLI